LSLLRLPHHLCLWGARAAKSITLPTERNSVAVVAAIAVVTTPTGGATCFVPISWDHHSPTKLWLLAVCQLIICLGRHACLYCQEDHVCYAVNNHSKLSELGHHARKHVANARKHLHTIVESDNTIVAWIWGDVSSVHDQVSSGGYSASEAAIAFKTKAARVARITDRPGFKARAVVVALAALVSRHVAAKRLAS
jgi:hypothetical protein